MSDATVSYWHLRLQLFPHLISKMSKQKHLTGLPKISISAAQLASWPGGVVATLKWRLSPWGRVPSRKRKDGEGKEETQEGGAIFFLLALMVPNFSRPLPPIVFSSRHKLIYHPQEQKLNETQRCFKSQAWPNAAQAPHRASAAPGEDSTQGWGAGTSAGLQAPALPHRNPPWVWVRCFISHRTPQQKEGWPTLLHFAPHRNSAAGLAAAQDLDRYTRTDQHWRSVLLMGAQRWNSTNHQWKHEKKSSTKLWLWEKRTDTPGASFFFKHTSFLF